MKNLTEDSFSGGLTRRELLQRGTLAATSLMIAGTSMSISAAEAKQNASLRGLGMSLSAFEARYGHGSPGQGANFYKIGSTTYAVTPASPASGVEGTITSVFWKAKGRTGDRLTRLKARMRQFRPSDAVLIETFYAPGNGVLPALIVELYKSPLIDSAFAGSLFSPTGNFIIAYGYSQDPSGDLNPIWADIYVGTGHA
jgi:hypothetical protein